MNAADRKEFDLNEHDKKEIDFDTLNHIYRNALLYKAKNNIVDFKILTLVISINTLKSPYIKHFTPSKCTMSTADENLLRFYN